MWISQSRIRRKSSRLPGLSQDCPRGRAVTTKGSTQVWGPILQGGRQSPAAGTRIPAASSEGKFGSGEAAGGETVQDPGPRLPSAPARQRWGLAERGSSFGSGSRAAATLVFKPG